MPHTVGSLLSYLLSGVGLGREQTRLVGLDRRRREFGWGRYYHVLAPIVDAPQLSTVTVELLRLTSWMLVANKRPKKLRPCAVSTAKFSSSFWLSMLFSSLSRPALACSRIRPRCLPTPWICWAIPWST